MPLLNLSIYQLLLAFTATGILRTLTFNRFFFKWLLSHKLAYFLPPSNDDLKELLGKALKKSKPKGRGAKEPSPKGGQGKAEVFKVPAQELVHLKLEKRLLRLQDIEMLPFSSDLEWIVDLGLVSLLSCALTQVQFYFYQDSSEWNFSILWALLVLVYCAKVLGTLTIVYFKQEEFFGERNLSIVSGCTFLLVAMCLLVADERYIDLGLEEARRSITKSFLSLDKRLSDQANKSSSFSVSIIFAKLIVSMICSFVGMMFTFPGFRFGQVHETLIVQPTITALQVIIYQINFMVPLFIFSMWIDAFSGFVIANSFGLLDSETAFEIFRISCIIALNIMHLYFTPKYVSVFLKATIVQRIERLRQRGGKVTNQDIQLTVTRISSYVTIMTIQYVLPALMCLFSGIILLSTGISDSSVSNTTNTNGTATILSNLTQQNQESDQINETLVAHILENTGNYWLDIYGAGRIVEWTKILSPEFFRGLVGFATFWLHFAWFATTATGVLYHKYLHH